MVKVTTETKKSSPKKSANSSLASRGKSAGDMGELLARYGGEFTTFRRGQIVEGSVVAVDHKAVLVDVGAKSEGIITGSELTDSEQSYKQLKQGDLVLSVVVQPENRMGYIVLSLKRAEAERKWREMNRLLAEETPFEVRVLEYGRGGLLVDALGLRGFVPISHLNRANFAEFNRAVAAASRVDTVQKLGDFVGKTLRVKVIELDRNQNRLVLSEKELEPKVSAQQVRELLGEVHFVRGASFWLGVTDPAYVSGKGRQQNRSVAEEWEWLRGLPRDGSFSICRRQRRRS